MLAGNNKSDRYLLFINKFNTGIKYYSRQELICRVIKLYNNEMAS